MILYVNGDSHSYGQDAGGPKFSYGQRLADHLKAEFVCHARSGASNARIIRTTREYLANNKPDFIIIGWSTWEREEWEFNGYYFDVNGSGHQVLHKDLENRYKEWVVTTATNWRAHEQTAHKTIWEFHQELEQMNIPHLFFNCYSYFEIIGAGAYPKHDWSNSYLAPYDKTQTYYYWLESQGYKPSNPAFFHYGPDAHRAWANFLLTKLTNESIITT